MSDTKRNLPHWAKPVPDAELEKYDRRSRLRTERFNRKVRAARDGAFGNVVGMVCTSSPRGYNTYDEVWGMHRKRKEKTLTHRTARRTSRLDLAPYDE